MPTVKLSPVYNGYNDNNGVPNSGGKITVNYAGTTTPATVYADSSGTVANTNPVILDSRGVPIDPIWLAVESSYDLSMTTSADVPLTHVYNVTGVNDTEITSGSEWVDSGLTAEYISTTSFKVPADATAYLLPYTRLKIAYLTSHLYSYVVSAVYATGFTTVTVVNDGASVLAVGIGAVSYGLLSPVNLSVPLTAQKVSGQNLLINPLMSINQEGTTTVTTTAGYSMDAWNLIFGGGLTDIVQAQATLAPTYEQAGRHLTSSLKTYTTVSKTGIAAGAYIGARQSIEGLVFQEIYRQPFVLRFWAYARTTGDYSVSLQSPGFAYSCVMKYTILAADTWQFFELNIPANGASGGWVFTNAVGMSLTFTVDAGSTFKTATLGAWQSGNYLACSTQAEGGSVINIGLYITDVEIQKGTVETTWRCEDRPYSVELSLCHRYFYTDRIYVNSVQNNIPIPTMMRATPTVSGGGAGFTVDDVGVGSNVIAHQTAGGGQTLKFNSRI